MVFVWKKNVIYTYDDDLRVSKSWANFHFCVNYPFKTPPLSISTRISSSSLFITSFINPSSPATFPVLLWAHWTGQTVSIATKTTGRWRSLETTPTKVHSKSSFTATYKDIRDVFFKIYICTYRVKSFKILHISRITVWMCVMEIMEQQD